MQPNLFLTPAYIQRRTQRTSTLLRFSGAVLLLALAAQILVVGTYLYFNHLDDEATSLGADLAQAKKGLQDKLKPFNETQMRYAQILDWMPLLKDRVPTCAILTYLQANLPADLGVRDLVLKSDDSTMTPAGFKRPKTYTLDLVGFNMGRDVTPVDALKKAFPGLPVRSLSLPPGSDSQNPPLWHATVTFDPVAPPVRQLLGLAEVPSSRLAPSGQ